MMAAANRPARDRGRSDFVVIKELEPLRDSPHGRLVVRILQGERGRRLDIREHIESDGFTGYTRRGICVTAEEFSALLEQRDVVLGLLDGGR